MEASSLPAELGEVLGGYELISVLGRGGMGCVYLARHALLGREAAVKVLATNLASDSDYVSRFFHEAKVVNDVRHPNIVDILDFVQTDEPKRVAYLMEYLEGPSLSAVLRERRLSVQQAVNATRQLAVALQAVHALGVVHRDLKPDNIIVVGSLDSDLSAEPSVKILDFGIAKIADPSAEHHTATGTMMGTPAYMAPEQVSALETSPATDVYALAEIFYEMVAGRRVFRGDNMVMFKQKLMGETPELPLPDDIAAADEVRTLTAACLNPDARARPSLADVIAALAVIQTRQPAQASAALSILGAVDVGQPITAATVTPLATGVGPSNPNRTSRFYAIGGGLLIATAAVIAFGAMELRSPASIDAVPLHPSAPAVSARPVAAPAPTPTMRAVMVRSTPDGAAVVDALDGTHLGFTPAEVLLKNGEARRVVVELAGHEPVTTELSPTRPPDMIELRAVVPPKEPVDADRGRTSAPTKPVATPKPTRRDDKPKPRAPRVPIGKREMPTW